MKTDSLKNKRVLIVGLGVTGSSVVRYLHKHGVAFDVVDEKAQLDAQLSALLQNRDVIRVLDSKLCTSYDVLVLSPGVSRALPAIASALEAGTTVIGDIELFASAISETALIAVTGSNGKSTVVSWLAYVLEACGKKVALCGNIGTPALDSISDTADVYVLELSSYQLESTRSLTSLSASVLNVSDDHLDRYDSIEHYAAVKRCVYAGCEFAVFNRDDVRTWNQTDNSAASSARSKGKQTELAFAIDSPTANDYQLKVAANDAWLCRGDEQLIQRKQLQVPGIHNVANALAVLALLEPMELDKTAVIDALSGFKGLEHRTEFVLEHRGVRWYNDSKGTNIDACEKAILAMESPVILIAGGQGKGANFEALRDVVAAHVKAVVIIGEDARLIHDALLGSAELIFASTLTEAVHRCSEIATTDDSVLLSPACASFDMFDNFEQRGRAFKQAVEVLAA